MGKVSKVNKAMLEEMRRDAHKTTENSYAIQGACNLAQQANASQIADPKEAEQVQKKVAKELYDAINKYKDMVEKK